MVGGRGGCRPASLSPSAREGARNWQLLGTDYLHVRA